MAICREALSGRVGMGCKFSLSVEAAPKAASSKTSRYYRIDSRWVPVFLSIEFCMSAFGFDQTGIHREALPAYQTLRNAPRRSVFEQVAQQIAVAKTAMAGPGECRMVRHPPRQAETARPAIGKVRMHFFAQPPLGPAPGNGTATA